MSGFSTTTYAADLKTRYSDDFVDGMVYEERATLALIPKRTDIMDGDGWKQPVLFEDPQAISSVFATAQTNASSAVTQISTFNVTRVREYGVITMDNELIEAAAKDTGAFYKTTFAQTDGLLRGMGRSVSTCLFRDGFGWIGQVSSPTASTTLTLVNKQDVVNFSKGMRVYYSATASGGTTLDSGEVQTVNGVDRNAGTLTMSANVTDIASIATNAYIFREGDYCTSTTRSKLAGFGAWIPSSAPSATTFFGVDRTADTRLGGCRYDGSSDPIDEAIINGAALVAREGGRPDHLILNPSQYAQLAKLLGTKASFVDLKVGNITFRSFEVPTAYGTIKVVSDRDCPVADGWMLQLNTWTLGSMGKIPRILNMDKLEGLRQATADGIEIRAGWYGNLICKAPGWNCRLTLAVPSTAI